MSKIYKYLVIVFILLTVLYNTERIMAVPEEYSHVRQLNMGRFETAPTLLPTVSPTIVAEISTPEARILPPIGSNAGLVIGASVLVLIIIGGVLGARSRQKH
jgi:hypothetical protein